LCGSLTIGLVNKQARYGSAMSPNLSRNTRFAAILIILGVVALIEARQPFPSFRLGSFVLTFLGLGLISSLLRDKLRDGFVVLASLAFGLSLVEATATILDAGDSTTVTNGWSVLQPVIGWGPEHAGRYHAEKKDPKTGSSIYSADYTIDTNLLRETHSAETSPTIVFFWRFLDLRSRSEQSRHATASLRGFARTQAKSAQS